MDPFIFGALIFGGGSTMMALHWDKTFRLKSKKQSDAEAIYHRSQYIRRMITSGMITLVGILFMIYRFLPEKSVTRIWMVAVVLLLVGAILVMALVDFSSLRKYYMIQGAKTANATRELADELKRLRKIANDKKRSSDEASGESIDNENSDNENS